MRLAKTQISLGTPVWTVFPVPLKLCIKAHSKDWSDWADAKADQCSLGSGHILLILSLLRLSNVYITRGTWATMLTWMNSYISLIQHFRLSVAMATNQNEEFVQLLYAWWRTTQQILIKKFCQNTCSEIAKRTYFHFSRYKSVATLLNCHSNESTWATAIQNTIFEEANVMNMSAKFQLHSPYGFRDDFLLLFREFILLLAMAINQIQRFGQNSSLVVEDYLSKYLQWNSNKGLFSLFPLWLNWNFKLS